MTVLVISDSYTPGAIALTRTGISFKANSVANIFVKCEAADFDVLYANCPHLGDSTYTRYVYDT